VAKFPLAVKWREGTEEVNGEVTTDNGYLWMQSTVGWPVTQVPRTVATQAIEVQGGWKRGPFASVAHRSW
jgi:hypothetical protein